MVWATMADTIPVPRWMLYWCNNQLSIKVADDPDADVGGETEARCRRSVRPMAEEMSVSQRRARNWAGRRTG